MEDQFGGRTDDDLFYDEFEPVEAEPIVTEGLPPQQQRQPHQPAASQGTSAPSPQHHHQKQPRHQQQHQKKKKKDTQPLPSNAKPTQGLMSSRYADPPPKPEASKPEPPKPEPLKPESLKPESLKPEPPRPEPAPTATETAAPDEATATSSATQPEEATQQQTSTAQASTSDGPPPNAPTAPRDKRQHGPNKDNVADREARLQSGANPRQKLTDAELTRKMEQMKLLSAEKTRKFEKAEEDEKQHAQAYARGMQEARKRQVEAEERRRRGEENQRQLNSEREKNRERKLKAMSQKEGGWDEGKEAAAQEEARRTFRGSNGGVRGTRRGAALGGGRVLQEGEELPDVDRFLDDRHRQRGRGRGRGGGGGGRGGGGGNGRPAAPLAQGANQAVPKSEDFPALPTSSNKPAGSGPKPLNPEPLLSPLPEGGKWDDEMEALDALKSKS